MTDRMLVDIDAIKVEGRFRQDLGDLSKLMQSIEDLGVLQPVVVTEGMRLVAGQRRLEACRRLGHEQVPVTVALHLGDARDLLTAERDENTCRKDMTASELYSLGKALEELERPNAAAAQAEAGSRNLGIPSSAPRITTREPVKTRDVVGESIGLSGPQWGRLKHIAEKAEEGDPEAALTLDAIDRGEETISGGYRKLRKPDARKETPRDTSVMANRNYTGRKRGFDRLLTAAVQLDAAVHGLTSEELALDANQAAQLLDVINQPFIDLRKLRKRLTDLAKESVHA